MKIRHAATHEELEVTEASSNMWFTFKDYRKTTYSRADGWELVPKEKWETVIDLDISHKVLLLYDRGNDKAGPVALHLVEGYRWQYTTWNSTDPPSGWLTIEKRVGP